MTYQVILDIGWNGLSRPYYQKIKVENFEVVNYTCFKTMNLVVS